MEPLREILEKDERLVIGLNSGTSVDGVDAALVKLRGGGLDTRVILQAFITHAYPPGIKEFILERSIAGSGAVDDICRLNVVLGEIFASAALDLVAQAGLQPSDIDLIGCHGQTVHHLPNEAELFGFPARSTLQLGEPSTIAKRTGIMTVGDFRPADMAVGGQGAPLVPYFDFVVFRSDQESRALLNIGGIANVTFLPRGGGVDQVVALDSGPGNMIIDALAQQHFRQPVDYDGDLARSGAINRGLLARLLSHPYFEQPLPKSTGRELFGGPFLREFRTAKLSPQDALATATALTAESIARAVERYPPPGIRISRLIVSGGGANNLFLFGLLREALPAIKMETSEVYGVPTDAKEAMCFALLANETINGRASNVPSCTGAAEPTVLGKICF
jgi:anhydro-N-acetylmuramic acid kinase